jgi:DNA-binding NtrC family response regulator
MTRNSSFRLDLYHRLNALVLRIPPLRERREEIEPLARYFLERSDSALEFLPEALTCLQTYDWPGNVRELRNVIERAIVVCDGHTIGRTDLPPELHNERCDIANVAPPEAVAVRDQPAKADAAVDLRARLAEHEIALIADALRRSAGNRRMAARLLRLPLRTLERKLHMFGPRIPSPQ